MFIYCFDEQEKNKLEKQLKLFKKTQMDDKPCWVFIIEGGKKLNFNEIDRGKCVVSDRLNF